MEVSKLVLLLALVGVACSSTPCPETCKCIRAFYGITAKCKELDPDVQRFSSDVTQLVVEDFLGERDMFLTDMFFIDMGLDRVSVIKIVNSTLRTIHVNAFHGLKHLQEVDLSNNRLISIHPDTFKNNKELNRLKLRGNPLTISQRLEIKDNHLLNSESLRELDLSYCRLTKIDPNTFSNLMSLELLDLSGNDLTEIKADSLRNLISLEELNLSYNSISKIDPEAFIDIEEMEKLSLKGNPIKTLEGIELPSLIDLDVSECDLEILSIEDFEGFPELNNLNLSRNSIKDIDPETFSSLPNLQHLDLSYNMIRGPIDRNLLIHNKKLETIRFAGNRELRVFTPFSGSFPRLFFFDISDCGLYAVNEDSFNNMQNIARLNMSNNNLDHIRPYTFEPLTHLNVLDLSNNRLHYVNNKLFSTNNKLFKLSMAGNNFRHVPAVLFENTPDLDWLDLSNCRLVTLWNITEAFPMKNKNIYGNLHYLNVSGNKLVKLHRHSFLTMKKLAKLDISNNPIQCTSDFSHVMQWLILNRVMPNKGTDKRPMDIGLLDNNIEWDDVLKAVCPINTQNNQPHPLNSIPVEDSKKSYKHSTLFKNTEARTKTESPFVIVGADAPLLQQGPEEFTEIKPIEDPPLVWPMVLIWISILSIFIALGNLVGLLIYRSRRQYRVLSYKPHFTSPLEGNFPVRRGGGRSPYQKLYEECSVPTPVHDKKIRIVTILENAFQKNNSKV